jgi:hypothetical protein
LLLNVKETPRKETEKQENSYVSTTATEELWIGKKQITEKEKDTELADHAP